MNEIEKQCFNQETPELDFFCRRCLLDTENRKLLWLLVVGSMDARDSGTVSDEDADKILKKLRQHKHTLIENKFPNDFFSKDVENFDLEAKCFVYDTMKVWPLPPSCQLIIDVLVEYVRRLRYPERGRMSFENAQYRIAKIQNRFAT